MFDKLFNFKNRNKNKLNSFNSNIKNAFNSIKKEFEQHLESINENTNEIQSNYELLLKLEYKFDKLETKMAEIESFFKQFNNQNMYFLDDKNNDSFVISPLTKYERKVFKVIYELEEEGIKVSYPKIAELLKISTSLVRNYILSLTEKGVPIVKNYINNKIYINLEPKFKEIQTKNNIINL